MFLSMLYPDEERAARAARGEGIPAISPRVCEELGLCALLPLHGGDLSSYFNADPEVITYRQEVFEDMARVPALCAVLQEAIPVLSDILELRHLDDAMTGDNGESYLYSITEIELYVSCIDRLQAGLAPLATDLHSRACRALCERIRELAESDYYRDLNQQLSALASRIREVKSVTIGVNLDEKLKPVEAGVIAVNADPFKPGTLLDKILRMSFRRDSMTCIAALVPFDREHSENRQDALTYAFHGALQEVFRSSVKGWRQIVSHYVLENTDLLLRILPEIEFLSRGAAMIRALRDKGEPLCFPTLCPPDEKALSLQGVYNAHVALQIDTPMVQNDFAFDDRGRLYVLTGPNRGGKSVITCAIGQAQALCQLGLPVPAVAATVSPVDGIYTHFPEGAEDTIDRGRLGEECQRLREIFSCMTENSLVLLDESLSSTGAYEAACIAEELLAAFGVRRVRGIFSTHLHEVASAVPSINTRSQAAGGVALDNLVAGMEEGERSFRMARRAPDGKSYARDIAARYGLSFEEIVAAGQK